MSEELEKIEPTDITLKICGKERKIKFGFSAWAKLEKKYGGMKNLDKLSKDIEEHPFEILPELIYWAISDKEGIDPNHIDEILDDYGFEDLHLIGEALNKALLGSLPKEDKKKVITPKKK